jgi:hypothetical protein
MFVKITQSGPRRYVQLVESFRDGEGRVKKRTVATVGRLDLMESVQSLRSVVTGLARLTGQRVDGDGDNGLEPSPVVEFLRATDYGDVYALSQLWQQLNLQQIARAFRDSRLAFDVEALIRMLVFNRLCDPESKLGALRWLPSVSIPGLEELEVEHHQLLRAMDALEANAHAVAEHTAQLVRPLIDQDLSVVFYDLTTVSVAGTGSVGDDDLRCFGMGKSGHVERQVMLALIQTADGLPLHHQVMEGNTSEPATLLPMLRQVLATYPIKRVIAVADRGLMSIDQIDALLQIRLPSGEPLEFILAVAGRRYDEFAERILNEVAGPLAQVDQFELDWPWLGDVERQARKRAKPGTQRDRATTTVTNTNVPLLRLVVAHDAERAQSMSDDRDNKIRELEEYAAEAVKKLDRQDIGEPLGRGRPLSDGGATARMYREVSEKHLGSIVRVNLRSQLFTYDINAKALQKARTLDGKLLLLTNVDRGHMNTREIIERYKSLADIERSFRVLKSDLDIGPMYHRLPRRIRAHAHICFIALLMQRVMRQRLQSAGSELSPHRALEHLRLIKRQWVSINGVVTSGIPTPNPIQQRTLAELGIKRPSSTLPPAATRPQQAELKLED